MININRIQQVPPSIRVVVECDESHNNICTWLSDQKILDIDVSFGFQDGAIVIQPAQWDTDTIEYTSGRWIELCYQFNKFLNGEAE